MFWRKLVLTLTNHILKHKNEVLKKTKTPEAVYLLKVTNKDTAGIIEIYSNWKYMTLFLRLYW